MKTYFDLESFLAALATVRDGEEQVSVKEPLRLSLAHNTIGADGVRYLAEAIKVAKQPVTFHLEGYYIRSQGISEILEAALLSKKCPLGTRITGLGAEIEEACVENDKYQVSCYKESLSAVMDLAEEESIPRMPPNSTAMLAAILGGLKYAPQFFVPVDPINQPTSAENEDARFLAAQLASF